MVWALGRLGQRVPLYGPLNTVVPTKDSATWLESLLQVEGIDSQLQLAVMEMARRTHDRHCDVSETLRTGVTAWLQQCDAPLHLVELVRDGGSLANEEQDQVFGEALPKGLRLRS